MKLFSRIHRQRLRVMLLAAALVFAFTGCSGGGSATPASSGAASGSDKAGELNLFVWTEYMPGSVFQAFTEETGIKVNVQTYSSNEDMLAKVKASNEGLYDVVVPSDYMVKMMAAAGLLEKLDHEKLPNMANIGKAYLNQSFDPGNEYSVPYMGGVAALVVNKSVVTEEITSYKQLFDPKYASSIVALNDFRAVIGMTAKSLDYSLNTTDDAELAQVASAMEQLKPNIAMLDSDSPKSALLSGEASIGYVWNAEIAIAMNESEDFDVVFPEEGCYLFLDNLSVLKGAKNPENALAFLDFIMRPEISKMVSEEFPYLNPNEKAVELLPDSYKNSKASNIPPEVIANGEYVEDIGEDVAKYDEIWTSFTS
ncbi:spermidine/putrescine ABC transporter substrate-binding protein [Oscillospiraceae bacterium MB08-C2-2]|nr:spermidine/putrescine ABC transporter substrate-binding protein [Oscillospiraceae bacterium MB08-C2-2]